MTKPSPGYDWSPEPLPNMYRNLALALLVAGLAAIPAAGQKMPVTTTSDAARAEYARGVDAVANLDYAAATKHLEAALAADPKFAMAHLYHAVATAEGSDEHMRLAAAGSASDAERQMIESYAAHRRGDHDSEGPILASIGKRFPKDPVIHLWIANHQAGRGNPAAAVEAARRGIAAEPSYAPLYNTLGYAEMAQGNDAAAEQAFRDYIRLAPGLANPYDSYGEFLMNAGRLDESEAQYKMAITKNPEFDPDRLGLARVGIARSDHRFEQAVAAGDADAIAALYTQNAIIMPPNNPPIQGRAAIRDYMQGLVDAGIDGVDIQTVEVNRFGDTAIERADIVISAGGQVVDRGKSLVVWRLVDGKWLYVRDMWSSNAPAPAASH